MHQGAGLEWGCIGVNRCRIGMQDGDALGCSIRMGMHQDAPRCRTEMNHIWNGDALEHRMEMH